MQRRRRFAARDEERHNSQSQTHRDNVSRARHWTPPNVRTAPPPLVVEGPRVVALVDVSGSRAYMERTRAALLKAVDELQPGTLFSLITFSDAVGVYQLGRRHSESS